MNWSIDFAPMLPGPFFWAAGAIALLLTGYLVYRRSRGALLRAAAIAAVLLALANPTLREEQRESLANVAIVIVDESASQTLGDRKAQTAAVKENLEAKRHDLAGHASLRRSQQGAGGYAARPARRRHHDHGRRGARRAEVGGGARLRCARACADHRRARRVRPAR